MELRPSLINFINYIKLFSESLRPVCTKRGLTKPGLSLKPGFTKLGLNLDLKLMHQIFKTRFS